MDDALLDTPGYSAGDITVSSQEAFDQFGTRIQDAQGRDTFELVFEGQGVTVLSTIGIPNPLPADGVLPISSGVLLVGAAGNQTLFVPNTGIAGTYVLQGEGLDDNGDIIPTPTVATTVTTDQADVTITGDEGMFTLTVLGQTTDALAIGASAMDVQDAVNALSTVAGQAAVTEITGGYQIDFRCGGGGVGLVGRDGGGDRGIGRVEPDPVRRRCGGDPGDHHEHVPGRDGERHG